MTSSTNIAVASIAAMREEALLRTLLVIVIAAVIPSMMVGSVFPAELSDVMLSIGPPISHLVHASIAFVAVLITAVLVSISITRMFVGPARPVQSLGPTISRMVEELGRLTGVTPEVQVTGGVRGGEIEAVMIGRRRIIRIAANRLPDAKINPDGFRFTMVHELTHLATGDPRTDRWIGCTYMVACIFMLTAFGGILWYTANAIAAAVPYGAGAVWMSVNSVALAILANTVSIGGLAILLFLEHRSAMRLREFHADAVATMIVGPVSEALGGLPSCRGGGLKHWIASVLSTHPNKEFRQPALAQRSVVFGADRVALVLQGFFAGTMVEMTLQLLFVNATAGVSSLAMRQGHMLDLITRHPHVVVANIAGAALLSAASQFLVFRRLGAFARETGGTRQVWKMTATVPLLVTVGNCLALLSSQTFLWELSQSGWRLDRWIALDPDRALIYGAGIAGVLVATGLALLDNGDISLSWSGALAIALIPIMFQLGIGVFFYS